MKTIPAPKEGWTYMFNASKWHYFTSDGRSLCKRWMLLALPDDLEKGNDNSPDNCAACKKKLSERNPPPNGGERMMTK